MPATLADVIPFWFDELKPADWFQPPATVDAGIRARFEALWEAERGRPVTLVDGDSTAAADDVLARVILLDQLPRNMYRNTPAAYATDTAALALAKAAVARGLDQKLGPVRRRFLYMPYMHSESLADHEVSLALFAALGDAEVLKWAHHHHGVIARFGRFPHRNAIFGRVSTAEEQAFGDQKPG